MKRWLSHFPIRDTSSALHLLNTEPREEEEGSRGAASKEDDFTEHLFIAQAHNYLLIFTEFGKVYWRKAYEIPSGNKTAKGRAIQNLINIEQGDNVRAIINVKTLEDPEYTKRILLFFVLKKELLKRLPLKHMQGPAGGY